MRKEIDAYICMVHRSHEPMLLAEFKLGGSPVFYREASWPTCTNCGQYMDFLVQVPLQHPLQFSKQYAMAYVFLCPGQFDENGLLTCETWDPYSGANKVIIQEQSGQTIPAQRISEYLDYRVSLEHVQEPLIDTSDHSLAVELLHSVHETTKIGGVPAWIQANEAPRCSTCRGLTKFVAQFGAALDGSLPADPAKWDPDEYKFFHFGGDDGLGYLFICEAECDPDSGLFLWQCT